jgi:putative N6-adenine-specific DNA methylase
MGLESVVKQELTELGYHDARAVGASGRVELKGDSEAIARCNIHLRSATRVMLVLARFPATTFDELFDSTTAVPWKDYIHAGASFPVRGKSVGSTLHSVPACQSIVKKAIIAKLLATGSGANFAPDTDGWVQEDARKGIFGVEVSIQKDEVTISLDTSGDALHRRGYRTGVLEGGAPLKETLAASMLLLSKWSPDRPLLDPFCGSGTILLEAALMAHNMAPGLRRRFAAEDWPLVRLHAAGTRIS